MREGKEGKGWKRRGTGTGGKARPGNGNGREKKGDSRTDFS